MSKVDELKKEIEELNRLKKEKIEELSKLATDEVCMSAYEFDRLNKENKAQKDEIEKLKHDLDEKISLRRSKEKKNLPKLRINRTFCHSSPCDDICSLSSK